jgi:hypothetical protein
MFPVTLQLLRCSVEARQRTAQNPDYGVPPRTTSNAPRWDRARRSPSAPPPGGGTAANSAAIRAGCQTAVGAGSGDRLAGRATGPYRGLDSTSSTNAAPLTQQSSASSTDPPFPRGPVRTRYSSSPTIAAAPAFARRSAISARRLLTAGRSDRATALKGPDERHLVGVLEVAADR